MLSINNPECVTSVPSYAVAIFTLINRKVLAFVLLYLYHQILKMHSIVGIFMKKKKLRSLFHHIDVPRNIIQYQG